MSIFEKLLKTQRCLWWQVTGTDAEGQPTYNNAAPVECRCRWETGTEDRVNSRAERYASKAHVFLDRDVAMNDVLWQPPQGTSTDEGATLAAYLAVYPDTPYPAGVPGACIVQTFEKMGKLNNKKFVREAWA